jgi:hypothetical protein
MQSRARLLEVILLRSSAIRSLRDIRGIPFPRDVNFRHIVVTGPLGSGKTTLVETIRGWSGEGYVNLTSNAWWRSRIFAVRPREIHFGIPFVGQQTVVDGEWLDVDIDRKRIKIPLEKKRFYNVDWRKQFAFDIQLPDADTIFRYRGLRARIGSHRIDETFSLAKVRCELSAYEAVAALLHSHGFCVYVRNEFQGLPRSIVS